MGFCSKSAIALAFGLGSSAAWAERIDPAESASPAFAIPEAAATSASAVSSTPPDGPPSAVESEESLSPRVRQVQPPPVRIRCTDPAALEPAACGQARDAGFGQDISGWDLSELDPGENLAAPPDQDEQYRFAHVRDGCLDGCANRPSHATGWADHVPGEHATHPGFWDQAGTVKTETLLFLGYFSVLSGKKLFKETSDFHFKNEGWFGKDTANIGIDKLTHAFDTYLLAEFLHNRIHRRSNASEGDALTAAALASGLMIFNEFSDGIEPDSGWSIQDVAMNLAGAGFSVLRNTVPGLKEKVAFKIEIMPNDHIYSYNGKPHYEQQRFMFSIKGAGFEQLARTPLRFVDLQVGYYASDFLIEDRRAGIEPKRHLFVGLGLNVGELLFGNSGSDFGKAAYSVLDYVQLPYTSVRYDTTGRFGH